MNQQLTLEVINEPGGGVLAQVAQALHARHLSPEAFVWSAIPDEGEARIWMIIPEDETMLRELTKDLGRIPGVRRVFLHGPGQAIKEALFVANGTR